MTVAEALALIDAWSKRTLVGYSGVPRSLRAMCIGAEVCDVEDFNRTIIEESQKALVIAARRVQTDTGCPHKDRCTQIGGCASYVVRARMFSAISVVMGCMQKHGSHFTAVEWPASDSVEDWIRDLALANGVTLGFTKLVSIPPGADPGEVIQGAIAEMAQQQKPTVN